MPIRKTSNETIEAIENEHLSTGRSISSICRERGINPSSVFQRIHARGLHVRTGRYVYNEQFFHCIDTQEKAYTLGFFYADGCVTTTPQHRAQIFLHPRDEHIIATFRDFLCPSMPVKRYRPGGTRPSGAVGCSFTNQRIVEQLIALKCTPRKSATLEFPTYEIVPEHLMPHFLRGYFDGDGCLFFSQRKAANPQTSIMFESSPLFVRGLQAYLWERLRIESQISARHPDCQSRSLRIGGNRQVLRFLDYLYHGATVSLDRKRLRMLSFIEAYKPHMSSSTYFDQKTGHWVVPTRRECSALEHPLNRSGACRFGQSELPLDWE
jgi:hypothetical protein